VPGESGASHLVSLQLVNQVRIMDSIPGLSHMAQHVSIHAKQAASHVAISDWMQSSSS
jgi:hypothetical protein